jgi:hypothetical protein
MSRGGSRDFTGYIHWMEDEYVGEDLFKARQHGASARFTILLLPVKVGILQQLMSVGARDEH